MSQPEITTWTRFASEASLPDDEAYFDDATARADRRFDVEVLQDPVTVIPSTTPLTLREDASVSDAMQLMRLERHGCVLVTEDGTARSRLVGLFTERDVLLKVIDSGRNPKDVPLSELMTRDPETVPFDASVARALNLMSVGHFRHVPITNAAGWPVAMLSVRLIVDFLVQSFPETVLNVPPNFDGDRSLERHGA
ncbi:MAG: CBS domain-containing protein [Myxococcota bacterium]